MLSTNIHCKSNTCAKTINLFTRLVSTFETWFLIPVPAYCYLIKTDQIAQKSRHLKSISRLPKVWRLAQHVFAAHDWSQDLLCFFSTSKIFTKQFFLGHSMSKQQIFRKVPT